MQDIIINCNGAATQVIIEGQNSSGEEEIIPSDCKSVIIAVPGNPGLAEFYKEFITAVNSRVPHGTPTLLIGHAGHISSPEKSIKYKSDNPKKKNYNTLEEQLKHKEEFINTYVPQDANLYLIGHSIGSWLILNLLKNQMLAKRVVKCYMLFPTIEHMAASPNGRFFTNIVTCISQLIGFLLWMFLSLPLSLQKFITHTYATLRGIPVRYEKAIMDLLKPHVLNRVFKLAKDEMCHVKELDDTLVSQNADKLWIYYGSTDGWTPKNCYENMRSKHPNVDAQLCHRGFEHSFVLKSATPMGHIVGDLINESMSKI